jgi:hypothetical protein
MSPEYLYEDPDTGEVKSVLQKTNEKHEYSEKGKKFDRVFTVPNASIDTKIDATSEKDFVEKTRNKKGSMGDLWNASREASAKRKEIFGKDKVKERYLKKYSDERKGLKHPTEKL